ncbi:MAG: haloacid dehalogenase-like hydrolase [Actinobacteria bacterium]|nr:haloacid dehalogenase-like hydrolase [Actinomycetota bacterium]
MRVVVDWDGTVTEVDSLSEVVRTFGNEGVYAETEDQLGRLTLNEVIAIEVATVSAPLVEVVDWVRENVRVRSGFEDFADKHRPLVVSSGLHELIEPVLQREGIRLDVRANRLKPRPGPWEVRFRDADVCDVCGEPCKRADVAGLGEFAYAGDGFSDRCVALAASRVFACDGLATYLESKGVGFERFEDFHDIAARLS